ncbi:MAG: M13 family metallopeptidase [Caulobacterales bacterium]
MLLSLRLRSMLAAAVVAGVLLVPSAGAEPEVHGVDFAGMDASSVPGDDFFAYANGGWLKTSAIPPDRSSWGADEITVERTQDRVTDLIKAAAASHPRAGTEAAKIADYYASYLDEAAIEAKGLDPIRPTLARIAALRSRTALAAYLGGQLRADVDILNDTQPYTPNFLGLWVAQDLDHPTRYAAFLIQGGLGMPARDYYLDASPSMRAIQAKYQAHVAGMLRLAGFSEPEARAARVVALERAIATTHASFADSEDVKRGDNHWSRAQLSARAPGLDWAAFLAAGGLAHQRTFVVWQPKAVAGEAMLALRVPLKSWRDYLAFHALEHAAPVLPKAFADEAFDFQGRVLNGTPMQRARWKQAVDATSRALGEPVGKLYVARWFPQRDKAAIQALVTNLIAAFGRRIDALDWMTAATKAKAKAKLATLRVGVGYPDRWRDYSGLRVVRGDAYGNLLRSEAFELRWNLAKLGRPVDRGEWVLTPQTVNAVNLPAMNALNFPAAELQPPVFDPDAPAAANYGAIGATIGHEISHSFDDSGALFDAGGRLANWWTPADFAHFRASADALVQQYAAYRPLPDIAVDGRQTLSENIADVAGLAVAYEAFRIALAGRDAPVVGGQTGDQQFYLAFAQSWRGKSREAALRRQVATDEHAPDEYRADTVRNEDPWYAAFGVQPGQKLYLPPQQRVRMW